MTIVRWAPSPTGRIHLGNARPAMLNWFFARRHGGRYVLRMDDTDTARSTREFADGIEADLAWLGITPDLLVRQSDRTALYDAARDRLIAAGRLYPCYETEDELDRRRKRARALGRPPIYDRAALKLTEEDRAKLEAEGRKPHWRFKLDGRPVQFEDLIKGTQTVNTASMSDPVLVREDGSYLYTLPSVVDDIDLGITHVIRGEDHVSNTGTQIEIFEALGGPVPIFGHHNLLTDAEGQGFSKRLGSQSLSDFRAEGYEPLAIAIMASITGTSLPIEPYASLDDIAAKLDFSMISHGAARFDPVELDNLNARLLHAMPYETALPRLTSLGLEGEAIWLLLRDNLSKFNDIVEWSKLVLGPVEPVIADEDRDFLALAKALLPPEPWSLETWGEWTNALKAATGRKGKPLFLPLRLVLTGRHDGPELKSLLPLVGRTACLARLP
ncbi:Glutamate--tRNA ligase [Devosia sp. LC5]|uniref:glutamate--tRNA ligase n=1 Tax=Devosia sp. LC5 TaxID=1502724 RepID=UPI0004E2F4BA|nr:glutamate--tRNA ligase [Devosia sp. LC5]KFC71237.1 Glutamate--tRNA ligase [Devosia sp. LC5]